MEIKDNTVPTPGPSPSGAGNQRSLTEGKAIGHRVSLTNAAAAHAWASEYEQKTVLAIPPHTNVTQTPPLGNQRSLAEGKSNWA